MYKHRPGVLGGCAARREGGMFSGAVYLLGDTRRLGRGGFWLGMLCGFWLSRCAVPSAPRRAPARRAPAPPPGRAVPCRARPGRPRRHTRSRAAMDAAAECLSPAAQQQVRLGGCGELGQRGRDSSTGREPSPRDCPRLASH